MKFLITLIAIFSFIVSVNAETPVPAVTPANRGIADEFLVFELEMAENSYTLNKDLENTTRLLRIYEKILYKRCLSEAFRSLQFAPKTGDQVCLEYSNKVFSLDPGNVVAYCVTYGVDSAECRIASQKQKTAVYDPEREEQQEKASLDDVILSRKEGPAIKKQTDELTNKLYLLARQSSKNKNKNKSLLEQKLLMQKVLDLNCRRSRIKLEQLTVLQKKPVETRTSSLIAPEDSLTDKKADSLTPKNTPDAFSEMLNKHFTTPTPEAVVAESFRVYQITEKCSEFIEDAFKIDNNFASALCYKWGTYSWQCMNALRQEAKYRLPKDTFTRPTGEIQKF